MLFVRRLGDQDCMGMTCAQFQTQLLQQTAVGEQHHFACSCAQPALKATNYIKVRLVRHAASVRQ